MPRWVPPPNWPAPPPGWLPPAGWRPDPQWPPPPEGWQFWAQDPVHCPAPAPSPAPVAGPAPRVRSARATALAVLLLIGVFPVGLAVMWLRTGWAKPIKSAVTAVAAVGVLAVAVTPTSPTSSSSRSHPPAAPQATGPTGPPSGSTAAAAPSGAPAGPEEDTGPPVPVDLSGVRPVPVAPGAAAACRADPSANVYHRQRLQVLSPCSTVSGQVSSVRREPDGDVHVDLAVDSAFRSMLVAGNTSHRHGWLLVEVVPADEPGCPAGQPVPATAGYDYGTCTGATVPTPTVGEQVWVTGPYVIDTVHGWAEIHPAWQIASTAPAPPAEPTAAAAAPSTPTGVAAAAPPATQPPAPAAAAQDLCGAPANPYGYTFCHRGNLITHPDAGVCNYFDCIANFSRGQGYLTECADHRFSLSGGRRGVCAQHGGAARPVYG